MAELVVEDRSTAGHVLGGARMADLPDRLTLRELLVSRVRHEVADHNADPGTVFAGLVQPEDSIAHSDGAHLDRPRRLDPDVQVRALLEAVRAGVVSFELDGRRLESLDAEIRPERADRLVVHLRRPIIARAPER